MQIILNSIQELKELASLIGTKAPFVGERGQTKPEEVKADNKPAAEKVKKDKAETKKDEEPKKDEKKEEVPKVEAEATDVNETSKEPPKDVEVKEESSGNQVEVTKEMVRAICSQAIKAGKAAEMKNIVSKYGASKIPELEEEHYAAAYKDVEALL